MWIFSEMGNIWTNKMIFLYVPSNGGRVVLPTLSQLSIHSKNWGLFDVSTTIIGRYYTKIDGLNDILMKIDTFNQISKIDTYARTLRLQSCIKVSSFLDVHKQIVSTFLDPLCSWIVKLRSVLKEKRNGASLLRCQEETKNSIPFF